MNAITKLALKIPLPQIARIEVIEHLVLRVTWSAGIRVGRTDVVDLSPMINSLKLYRPLREGRLLFRSAHLIEDGRIIGWGDDEQIDMAADSVEELAEETMTPDDLREFLTAYNLTHAEAAALLDRSRRTIESYLSGSEPIPRVFVLACYGLVARKQFLRGGLTSRSGVLVSGEMTETLSSHIRNLRPSEPTAAPTMVPETSANGS